jgi:predicted aspartyl protease
LAANATTIAESAQSPDDWSLAVSRWQEAISLLKAVPNSSPYSKNAKSKITQYQQQLADASKRAKGAKTNVAQSPNKSAAKDPKAPVTVTMGESTGAEPTTAPEVFTIPIKRRSGGAPVIDVTFNGSQTFEMILDTGASNTLITKKMADALAIVPAGKTKADTASSNGVEFSFGYVSSMAAGGIVATDVQVSIAGSGLDLGLLGHDFFGKYDVTIKRDVVELQEQK